MGSVTSEHQSMVGSAATARDGRAFPTTHWSRVVAAATTGVESQRMALEELCRTYWYPVYGFARRCGHTEADAQDLTQGVFAELLAHGSLKRADAARGRFRTYLLAVFEHVRNREHARAGALKRGGGQVIVSLDELLDAEARFQQEPATTEAPDKTFDRKWAVTLLENALAAMRHEYAAAGKAALFDELKVVLWGGRGAVSYVEIAARLGVTEGAIKVAMFRARRRFREQLGAEVAKTLLDPAEIDDELRHLFAALAA